MINPLNKLKKTFYRRIASANDSILSISEWPQSLRDPTLFQFKCDHFFNEKLPAQLREHREYFNQNRRGFGEDSFHAMWFILHRAFEFKTFLEIGVYRGQVVSLVALLQQMNQQSIDVTGISPFSAIGDTVSEYLTDIDYLEDTLLNFQHFNLPKPKLVKAMSSDPEAKDIICSRLWDCIYIDGDHDYDAVKADWNVCSAQIAPGGIIIFDDASLSTRYKSPLHQFRGHPGPSQVADEVNPREFAEILQVGHNRVFRRR